LRVVFLRRGPDGNRVGRVRAERRRPRLLGGQTHAVGASGGRRWARCLAGLLTVLVLGPIASMMWAGPAWAAPSVFAPVAGSPFDNGGNAASVAFSRGGGGADSGGGLAVYDRRRQLPGLGGVQ